MCSISLTLNLMFQCLLTLVVNNWNNFKFLIWKIDQICTDFNFWQEILICW